MYEKKKYQHTCACTQMQYIKKRARKRVRLRARCVALCGCCVWVSVWPPKRERQRACYYCLYFRSYCFCLYIFISIAFFFYLFFYSYSLIYVSVSFQIAIHLFIHFCSIGQSQSVVLVSTIFKGNRDVEINKQQQY